MPFVPPLAVEFANEPQPDNRVDANDHSDVHEFDVEMVDPACRMATQKCTIVKSLIEKMLKQLNTDDTLKTLPITAVRHYIAVLEKHWNQYFENHVTRVCAMASDKKGPFDDEVSRLEDVYNELNIALVTRLSLLSPTRCATSHTRGKNWSC